MTSRSNQMQILIKTSRNIIEQKFKTFWDHATFKTIPIFYENSFFSTISNFQKISKLYSNATAIDIRKKFVTNLVYRNHWSAPKPNKRGQPTLIQSEERKKSTHQDQRTFCLVDKFLFRQIQKRTAKKKLWSLKSPKATVTRKNY